MSNVLVHPALATRPDAVGVLERATQRVAVVTDGGRRVTLLTVRECQAAWQKKHLTLLPASPSR